LIEKYSIKHILPRVLLATQRKDSFVAAVAVAAVAEELRAMYDSHGAQADCEIGRGLRTLYYFAAVESSWIAVVAALAAKNSVHCFGPVVVSPGLK
jgi:hypothetical protein